MKWSRGCVWVGGPVPQFSAFYLDTDEMKPVLNNMSTVDYEFPMNQISTYRNRTLQYGTWGL